MTTPLDTWERALRSRVAAALPRVTVVIGALPAKPDRALAVKAYADPVPLTPPTQPAASASRSAPDRTRQPHHRPLTRTPRPPRRRSSAMA